MAVTNKLMDEFNPDIPGKEPDWMFVMFMKAAEKGVMETFQRMPVDKQREFINRTMDGAPIGKRTALIVAALNYRADVVEHLLTLNPDLDRRDAGGWTALSAAAHRGSTRIVRMLLDAGASIDLADIEHWTPLMDAIGGGHTDAALLLIERGASPLAINDDGDNALDMAIDQKREAIIPALKKASTDYHSKQVARVMGQTQRDVSAPAPATFKRRA